MTESPPTLSVVPDRPDEPPPDPYKAVFEGVPWDTARQDAHLGIVKSLEHASRPRLTIVLPEELWFRETVMSGEMRVERVSFYGTRRGVCQCAGTVVTAHEGWVGHNKREGAVYVHRLPRAVLYYCVMIGLS